MGAAAMAMLYRLHGVLVFLPSDQCAPCFEGPVIQHNLSGRTLKFTEGRGEAPDRRRLPYPPGGCSPGARIGQPSAAYVVKIVRLLVGCSCHEPKVDQVVYSRGGCLSCGMLRFGDRHI